MPSVPRRTALAAAALVVAAGVPRGLGGRGQDDDQARAMSSTPRPTAAGLRATCTERDVVVRCGKGRVGQVDWSFRMRDGAGYPERIGQGVHLLGGSCKSVAAWQLQQVITVGGRHLLLVKVPFVGRSPDVAGVVATVT